MNSRNDEFCLIVRVPHNEIATSCKQLSQWRCGSTVIARSETTKQSTNHQQPIHSQKTKKIHCHLPPSSLRDFVEVVAIHKPQKVNIKTKKKKNSPPFAPSSLRDFVEVVAIHKPQNHHKKTENKKKSLIIDLYYFYFITK